MAEQVSPTKSTAQDKDKSQEVLVPWPDFSRTLDAQDLELKMFCFSRGRRYLLLQNGRNHEELASQMGFIKTSSGVWVRSEGQVTSEMFKEWQGTIPGIGIKRVTPQSVVVGDSLYRAETQDLVEQSLIVGFNRDGMQVFQHKDNGRRFVKNPRGWKVTWEPEEGAEAATERALQPDAFLRHEPGNRNSLLRSAEGVLFSMGAGMVDGEESFKAISDFVGVSAEAMKAAIGDSITRSYSASRGLAREVFEAAREMENKITFGTGALPPSLQTALGRVLGNANELRNAKVTFAGNIGDLGVAMRLPRTAELNAVVENDEEADRASAIARGNHSAMRLESPTDRVSFHDGSDLAIHHLEALDAEEVEALHDYRAVDGRSLLIVDCPADLEEEDAKKFLREIGRSVHLENAALVSGSYITKEIGSPGKLVVSLGPRRSTPVAADEVELPNTLELNDANEAWRFSVETLHTRRVAEEAAKLSGDKRTRTNENGEAVDSDVDLGEADEPDAATDFQVPYITAARELGEPEALLPRYLDGASRNALEGLVRRRGNVIEFLCDQFDWTKDQLAENLSAEQADGVALWIDARLRRDPTENSVIIADGTGTGKGRQLAATMVWAAMRGEKTVFLTENVKLLNDIWNDLREMKMTHLFNPLVTNQTKNAVIVDLKTHEPIFPPADSAILEQIYATGEIPEEINLVLGSYTQLNKHPKDSARVSWFHKIVGDCHLATDEAHVAAGNGITARNVQSMIGRARHHTPASGTWSKDIRAIPFYHRAIPNSLPANQLVDIFRKGGVTAQEAFTSMMVKAGRMVRREMGLNQIEFSTISDGMIGLSQSADNSLRLSDSNQQRAERNRALSAQVSERLAEIAKFSAFVKNHIGERDREMHARLARRRRNNNQAKQTEVEAIKGTTSSFGSPLHQFSRVFEAAMVADLAVEEGIKAIEADEKPIFVTALTGENYIKTLLEHDETRMPTIKDALERIIIMACKYQRQGESRSAIEENEDLLEEFQRIKEKIAELPDFPILATDIIKNEFRKRNISASEISGRKYEIVDQEIVTRRDPEASDSIHRFQNGDIDALFLGKPGFTGITLHSSEKAKDQRKRHMLMVLPPQDILELFQVLGRVARRKQVTGASVSWLSSGLPASLKLSMYIERHMQRLSANTTSNRQSAVSRGELIPDIFNSVGHEVCFRFLENNPVLAERMGLADIVRMSIEEDESLNSVDRTWANKVMTYMHLLHPDEQDRVMSEIFEEYEQVIEELDARNENPLKTKSLPGSCQIVTKDVFDGVENGSGEHEPVYLVEVAHTQEQNPMRSEEVLSLVDNAESEISRAQLSDELIFKGVSSRGCVRSTSEIANTLRATEKDILNEALERHNAKYPSNQFETVEAALRDFNGTGKINRVRKMNSLIDELTTVLPKLRPGASIIHYSRDTLSNAEGIITDISCPRPGKETSLSQYRVSAIWPGDDKPQNLSLSFILSSIDVFVGDGIHNRNTAQATKLVQLFDEAKDGEVTHARHFLMGNILEALRISTAMDKPLGQISTFTDENGNTQRGLLIKEASKAIELLPVSIAQAPIAAEVLARPGGADLYSTSNLSTTKGVLIRRGAKGNDERPETFMIRYPTTRGADSEIYENESVRKRIESIGTKRGRPVLEVTAHELPEVLKELIQAGVTFYAPPSARTMTNEIASDRAKQEAAADTPEMHAVLPAPQETEIGDGNTLDNDKTTQGVGFDDDALNMLAG